MGTIEAPAGARLLLLSLIVGLDIVHGCTVQQLCRGCIVPDWCSYGYSEYQPDVAVCVGKGSQYAFETLDVDTDTGYCRYSTCDSAVSIYPTTQYHQWRRTCNTDCLEFTLLRTQGHAGGPLCTELDWWSPETLEECLGACFELYDCRAVAYNVLASQCILYDCTTSVANNEYSFYYRECDDEIATAVPTTTTSTAVPTTTTSTSTSTAAPTTTTSTAAPTTTTSTAVPTTTTSTAVPTTTTSAAAPTTTTSTAAPTTTTSTAVPTTTTSTAVPTTTTSTAAPITTTTSPALTTTSTAAPITSTTTTAATTPTTVTTSTIATTTPGPVSVTQAPNLPIFIWPCKCVPNKVFQNMTMEEIVQELVKKTKIDTKTTTLALSKRLCREDSRTSATATGMVGVVMLSFVGTLLMSADLMRMFLFFKQLWVA